MPPLISRSEVENLTSDKVVELLSLKVVEKTHLDYKSKLSYDSKGKREIHKEILKDITSFANSRGGIILIGVQEPNEELEIENQVLGIHDCKTISTNIERLCATSIEPRIPGLVVTFLQVFDKKEIIIIFIPSSTIKPHMVNYDKHRAFYIRHTESSVPMTVQEIRDAVLYSSNIEKNASIIAQNEEIEIFDYYLKDEPAFLFQAVPLNIMETEIDVESQITHDIIVGNSRSSGGQFSINSQKRPTPTIKGVMGSNSRYGIDWTTEIHRNGFIQLVYKIEYEDYTGQKEYKLFDKYIYLMRLFLDFCEEIWSKLNIDSQYLLKCKIVNTTELFIFTKDYFNQFQQKKYGKHQIVFQDIVKNIGENSKTALEIWQKQFYNAQGRWQE